MKTKIITGLIGLLVVIGLGITALTVKINDAGFRTVVQLPTGSLSVRFDPGWYVAWFGKTTVYPDYFSYDFSAQNGQCSFARNDGVNVRYQDGGEGAVCGLARVQLPLGEAQMLQFHKAYRDEEGVRSKLMNLVFPKALNLTAALMTSEEGYSTKRSEFIQISADQAVRGIYKTKLVDKIVEVGVDENGAVETQTRKVPEPIMGEDGQYLTNGSDFSKFGLTVVQFDLTSWDFEEKTLTQISEKRSAEMAIVTAQANEKKAYFQEQEVIAKGKKAVAEAEYKEKEIAARQVIVAEREKEVATIAASQKVSVAEQAVAEAQQRVLEQEQIALAKKETAKGIITIANAEAHAKKVIIQADNALTQKLTALVEIATVQANAQANRAVPATVIYSGGATEQGGNLGGGDDVTTMLQTQMLKNLGALDVNVRVAK